MSFARGKRIRLRQAPGAWPGGGAQGRVNEIIAARELLALLDLTGMLVTGDAVHRQNDACTLIAEKGGDWLVSDRRYSKEPRLPGLTTLALVEAEVTRDGNTTISRRSYVSSASLTQHSVAAAARAHWSIENSLHYVLETAFNEDRARTRKHHGPENLAILRKLALNTLQNARKDISIRRKRKRSGWSDDFARTILGQMR